jgi:hypothetical protein
VRRGSAAGVVAAAHGEQVHVRVALSSVVASHRLHGGGVEGACTVVVRVVRGTRRYDGQGHASATVRSATVAEIGDIESQPHAHVLVEQCRCRLVWNRQLASVEDAVPASTTEGRVGKRMVTMATRRSTVISKGVAMSIVTVTMLVLVCIACTCGWRCGWILLAGQGKVDGAGELLPSLHGVAISAKA